VRTNPKPALNQVAPSTHCLVSDENYTASFAFCSSQSIECCFLSIEDTTLNVDLDALLLLKTREIRRNSVKLYYLFVREIFSGCVFSHQSSWIRSFILMKSNMNWSISIITVYAIYLDRLSYPLTFSHDNVYCVLL